jgi:hypothetical protein
MNPADPLFTVPLAGNARFQARVARLEAQMKNRCCELRRNAGPHRLSSSRCSAALLGFAFQIAREPREHRAKVG